MFCSVSDYILFTVKALRKWVLFIATYKGRQVILSELTRCSSYCGCNILCSSCGLHRLT